LILEYQTISLYAYSNLRHKLLFSGIHHLSFILKLDLRPL